MQNEQCWVLMGYVSRLGWIVRYDRHTSGQPASVAFDSEYVWENRKVIKGWLHTHPCWTATPSGIDHATMRAQVTAIGRPLLCIIEGVDGIRAYWYMDDESKPIEVPVVRIGNKLFGLTPRKRKKHDKQRMGQACSGTTQD